MFFATLIHRTWLANDLADIRDGLKSTRRAVSRLLADCYQYSLNCTAKAISDFVNGSQRACGTYAFHDTDVDQTISRHAHNRRTALFAVGLAGGVLTAIWLERRASRLYR